MQHLQRQMCRSMLGIMLPKIVMKNIARCHVFLDLANTCYPIKLLPDARKRFSVSSISVPFPDQLWLLAFLSDHAVPSFCLVVLLECNENSLKVTQINKHVRLWQCIGQHKLRDGIELLTREPALHKQEVEHDVMRTE